MKQEELIIDAFYAVKYKGKGDDYIFQNTDTRFGLSSQPYMCSGMYSRGTIDGKYNPSFAGADYRVLTAAEISHLKACIKANKYVPAPKPEIINEYEIY